MASPTKLFWAEKRLDDEGQLKASRALACGTVHKRKAIRSGLFEHDLERPLVAATVSFPNPLKRFHLPMPARDCGKKWPRHGCWTELDDGRIYDAVKDSYEPAEQYMARNEAIVDHRYSQREMCHLVSVSGNAGPCTDDEREAARIRGIRITDMERTQS